MLFSVEAIGTALVLINKCTELGTIVARIGTALEGITEETAHETVNKSTGNSRVRTEQDKRG